MQRDEDASSGKAGDPTSLALLGEIGPRTRSQELDTLRSLPEETQAFVLSRLVALHAYDELAQPTAKDAERLAATIGIKRTNFMRLLSRLRQHGLDALIPHRRVAPRVSKSREGLPAAAEKALAVVLAEEPMASLSDIARRVRSMLSDDQMPVASMLRRRVYAARQAGAEGPAAAALNRPDAVFGRKIVIGGTPSDIRIDRGIELGDQRLQSCFLGLVVDVETRLIVGAGLSPHPEEALAGAILDVQAFLRRMTIGEAAVSSKPPRIVTGRREDDARGDITDVEDDAGYRDAYPDFSVPEVLQGRSTRLLFRMIGDSLGRISLRERDSRSQNTDEGFGLKFEDARRHVREEVDAWNYRILCTRARVRADAAPEVVARRLREWSSRKEPSFWAGDLQSASIFQSHDAIRSAVHGVPD